MKVKEAVEVLGGYERMGFGDLELRTSDEEALAEASSTGVYMTRSSFVLVVHGIPPTETVVAPKKAKVSRGKRVHIGNRGARSFCGRIYETIVKEGEQAPMIDQEAYENLKARVKEGALEFRICAKCRAAYEGTVKREKVADAKDGAASLPF